MATMEFMDEEIAQRETVAMEREDLRSRFAQQYHQYELACVWSQVTWHCVLARSPTSLPHTPPRVSLPGRRQGQNGGNRLRPPRRRDQAR